MLLMLLSFVSQFLLRCWLPLLLLISTIFSMIFAASSFMIFVADWFSDFADAATARTLIFEVGRQARAGSAAVFMALSADFRWCHCWFHFLFFRWIQQQAAVDIFFAFDIFSCFLRRCCWYFRHAADAILLSFAISIFSLFFLSRRHTTPLLFRFSFLRFLHFLAAFRHHADIFDAAFHAMLLMPPWCPADCWYAGCWLFWCLFSYHAFFAAADVDISFFAAFFWCFRWYFFSLFSFISPALIRHTTTSIHNNVCR